MDPRSIADDAGVLLKVPTDLVEELLALGDERIGLDPGAHPHRAKLFEPADARLVHQLTHFVVIRAVESAQPVEDGLVLPALQRILGVQDGLRDNGDGNLEFLDAFRRHPWDGW